LQTAVEKKTLYLEAAAKLPVLAVYRLLQVLSSTKAGGIRREAGTKKASPA